MYGKFPLNIAMQCYSPEVQCLEAILDVDYWIVGVVLKLGHGFPNFSPYAKHTDIPNSGLFSRGLYSRISWKGRRFVKIGTHEIGGRDSMSSSVHIEIGVVSRLGIREISECNSLNIDPLKITRYTVLCESN